MAIDSHHEDAETPKPSARIDGVFQNARWNRIELDAFPALEQLRELHLIVARYDIFAIIWVDKWNKDRRYSLFVKGEDKSLSGAEAEGALRPGAILADDADQARGWYDALKFWKS